MDQNKAEKTLCLFYTASVICGLVASISIGIVWGHWKLTLNHCDISSENRNCSCILYSKETPTRFIGGSLSICAWIGFGPVPMILTSIALAIFHGIRSCFGSKTEATRSIMTKNEAGEIIHMQIRTTEQESLARTYWIIASTLTVIFTVYMLGHFATFADGYLHTCNQYRRELIKILALSGTAVDVIYKRISCNAVYDFMDYLQQTSGDNIRDDFINTSGGLISGLVCSFFSVIALLYASIINIKMARV